MIWCPFVIKPRCGPMQSYVCCHLNPTSRKISVTLKFGPVHPGSRELIVAKRVDSWHYVNSTELLRGQFPCIHTINIKCYQLPCSTEEKVSEVVCCCADLLFFLFRLFLGFCVFSPSLAEPAGGIGPTEGRLPVGEVTSLITRNALASSVSMSELVTFTCEMTLGSPRSDLLLSTSHSSPATPGPVGWEGGLSVAAGLGAFVPERIISMDSLRLQELHCVSNGVTAVLRSTIHIFLAYQIIQTKHNSRDPVSKLRPYFHV